MAKVLVVYFSASGVTEKVAKELANVNEGKRLGGSVSEEDLKIWTNGLGL